MVAATQRAGLLRLMAQDLPFPVASIRHVYYVRPVLNYASPVRHGSLREKDAMSLERIQTSVARSLLQAGWFTPKEELFRQLGWPAPRWRREITSLTMFTSSNTAVRNHSANVCSSTQMPPQLAAAASHSNCPFHTHAPHATENLFSIDQLFYGTHSRTTYNHSRIVNHFAMLSRTSTNHTHLPQQNLLHTTLLCLFLAFG